MSEPTAPARVLVVHGYNESHSEFRRMKAWFGRLRTAGFTVSGFSADLGIRGLRLRFADLDRAWKQRDQGLMSLYARLAEVTAENDVLINFGAVNLHPTFLEALPTLNILRFNDDPESSEEFSR